MIECAGKRIRGSLLGSAVVLNLLAGCATGLAEDLSSSRWTEHRLSFDERQLVFQVPPENHRLPPIQVISQVNLARDLGPQVKENAVMMLQKSWDFKGWFWEGNHGFLAMAVNVIRKDPANDKDLRSLEILEKYIKHQWQEDYERFLEKLRKEGSTEYARSGPPERFERVTIAEAEWLRWNSGRIVTPGMRKQLPEGSQEAQVYSIPLSVSHYLIVSFIFSDTSMSRGYTSDWRQDAKKLAEQIRATIQLK